MKGIIELKNFNVENISLKCTTPLETKDEGEFTVQMYGKCIIKIFKLNNLYKATIRFKSDKHQRCRA